MGLYDDDNASVTGGDVLDVLYWQVKWESRKLDAALAAKQPEGEIRFLTISIVGLCDDVLKTYPNHADVKAWKDKALKIQGKCNPDSRPEGWKTDFAYMNDNAHEMAWRHSNIVRMAHAASDMDKTVGFGRDAMQALERCKDRMPKWPADVQKWVAETTAATEKLIADAKSKM